jgi:sugar/nucleoside kinase (ribokinase family)
MATGGVNPPSYVLLGHLTLDRIGGEVRCGGTVLYAGVTALRLGYRAGLITATSSDVELPPALDGAEVIRLPSEQPTTYELVETERGRRLTLCARAAELVPDRVPARFREAHIAHLAPVAGEMAPSIGELFSHALVGVTPQGWLRTTQLGPVSARPEQLGALPLTRFGALVLSEEDVGGDVELVQQAAAQVPVIALTRGGAGSTLYTDGQIVTVPAFPAREVDPTGAGDVFAAAFFIRLHECGDALRAARFASCVAALSVEGEGVEAIPDRIRVEARLGDGSPVW